MLLQFLYLTRSAISVLLHRALLMFAVQIKNTRQSASKVSAELFHLKLMEN